MNEPVERQAEPVAPTEREATYRVPVDLFPPLPIDRSSEEPTA